MRLTHRIGILAVLATLVALAVAATSCIYDPQTGEAVISEKICVNLTQHVTDGNISGRAIADQFRERLLAAVQDYGATLDDIKSISVTSGTYKIVTLKGHDWTVTGDVYVFRKDTPSGPVTDGPAKLLSFQNQSLMALKGKPADASLQSDGVALLNRALDDLLLGADPVIYVDLQNESITPVPSMSDPLDFRWLACVEFQAVVDVTVNQN